MKTILVATDGSEAASRAVDVAADMAKATGAKLKILTVESEQVVPPREFSRLARAEGDVGASLDTISRKIVHAARERAKRIGASSIQTEVVWGDTAKAIIERAAAQGADAIVLGRRGLGQLQGLLVGSVSQKVVSLAPCTVIVVP